MPEGAAISALAFDFGLRRIGVAAGQSITGSAAPVGVVAAQNGAPDWSALDRLVKEWAPDQLVVGLPYTMDGNEQEITRCARRFAGELERRYQRSVHTIDESLSSREAEARLKELRQQGRRRITRGDIDCAAACVILESVSRPRQPRHAEPRMTSSQFDTKGHLQHLLTLADMPRETLTALLDRAEQFCVRPGDALHQYDLLAGKTVANLFFEPSTRTRASFELATQRLGAHLITLDLAFSSTVKGESLLDTFYTLEAMNVEMFIVRHKEPDVPETLAQHALPHTHIINAGEAHVSHPTQGLLDAFTIRRHKKKFENLAVAIVGDIRHSRVARSTLQALTLLGTQDIRLAGPAELLPDDLAGEKFTNVDKALAGADVVIMLRIQKERVQTGLIPDEREYSRRYGLDAGR